MRATVAPGSLQAQRKPSVLSDVARMSEATSGERLTRISLRSCELRLRRVVAGSSKEDLRVDRCSSDEPTGRANARPMTGSAISGKGCPAYRCAHAGYSLSRWSARLRSRGMMRPGFVNHSPQKKSGRSATLKRGTQETPGARCTRSPCATGSKHTVVTTGSPKTPGVSCAMVLTAYGALFPATNSSCHRHRRIKVHRSPVGLVHLRRFSTSNGCRNHTLLPSAATSTDPQVSHVLPTAFQSRR
jgi:hypothetical protein